MVDKLTPANRSKVMASIKGKNTGPELTVRRLLWAMGKRYKVHDREITGTPDISNRRAKVAVFIDGCFWHGCRTCYREPQSNVEYWRRKLQRNRQRRKVVKHTLKSTGWHILEFWEHEVAADPVKVAATIA